MSRQRFNKTVAEIIRRLVTGEAIPKLSLTEVAALFGVRRQRIHQVLDANFPAREKNEKMNRYPKTAP